MSDEPKGRSRKWMWCVTALALLMLYPLSTGPVMLLTGRCNYPIYGPLFRLGEKSDLFASLLFFYWCLWGAKT
jgi:hypothetical protein